MAQEKDFSQERAKIIEQQEQARTLLRTEFFEPLQRANQDLSSERLNRMRSLLESSSGPRALNFSCFVEPRHFDFTEYNRPQTLLRKSDRPLIIETSGGSELKIVSMPVPIALKSDVFTTKSRDSRDSFEYVATLGISAHVSRLKFNYERSTSTFLLEFMIDQITWESRQTFSGYCQTRI